MAPPTAEEELRQLDPEVWKACVGTTVRIPTVGSCVYYFPQGHAEQASSLPDFSPVPTRNPSVRCHVAAVSLFASPGTDEVFAKFVLDPRLRPPSLDPDPHPELPPAPVDPGRVLMAEKVLTQSDANNGGGFSVPVACANHVFPALNKSAHHPEQFLSIRDVQGRVWTIRHIYRGSPLRHLLTTGWSKFVDSKMLVAGDTVVFIKNRAGDLFVVIRRAARSRGRAVEYTPLADQPTGGGVAPDENVMGGVPPESVVNAVRLAGMNVPFEVDYYPKANSVEFVVAADIVEAATRVRWAAGMRVKMAKEMDSSKTAWFEGTVTSTASAQDPAGVWPDSPWRMLQVTWDEPEVVKDVRSVNPWQVVLASDTPVAVQEPIGRAIKKPRLSHNQELPNPGEASNSAPAPAVAVAAAMGNLTPSLINPSRNPAGMQGARHVSSSECCLSDLGIGGNTDHLPPDNLDANNMHEDPIVRAGESPQAPQSQGSSVVPDIGRAAVGAGFGNATRTIRLFGEVIEVTLPSCM